MSPQTELGVEGRGKVVGKTKMVFRKVTTESGERRLEKWDDKKKERDWSQREV